MERVEESFRSYGDNSAELDGRQFVKLCRDSKWCKDGFVSTDADLIFTKVKCKGARRIDFDQFLEAIEHIAVRKQCPVENLLATLSAGPLLQTSVKPGPNSNYGPERFFYDKSSFTGAHVKGGPTTLGTGERGAAGYGGLSSLIDRDHVQDDPLQRKKLATATQNRDTAALLNGARREGYGRQGSRLAERNMASQLDDSSGRGGLNGSGSARPGVNGVFAPPRRRVSSHASSGMRGPERFYLDKTTYTGVATKGGPQVLDGPKVPSLGPGPTRPRKHEAPPSRSTNPNRGPERFFYDQSSYTGAHRAGGPTAKGGAVGTGGYSDLSTLIRREHVQNDNLQRGKQRVNKQSLA